jgi:hypothetical protein
MGPGAAWHAVRFDTFDSCDSLGCSTPVHVHLLAGCCQAGQLASYVTISTGTDQGLLLCMYMLSAGPCALWGEQEPWNKDLCCVTRKEPWVAE